MMDSNLPIPTIEDEFKLFCRGFVRLPVDNGGSGARRCGVRGMSQLKYKEEL